MIDTIKCCPFCSSKAVVHVQDGVRVVCISCGASSKALEDGYTAGGKPAGTAIQRVVEAWNRRALPDANAEGAGVPPVRNGNIHDNPERLEVKDEI